MKKFKIKKAYTYFLDCEIEAETKPLSEFYNLTGKDDYSSAEWKENE